MKSNANVLLLLFGGHCFPYAVVCERLSMTVSFN